MSKAEVKAVCESCGGTGLYRGMAEPHGVAVVCLQCDGTGCHVIKYTPFVERKVRCDTSTVRRSRGSFIATGVGPTGNGITYAEFLNGKMP